MKNLIKYFCHLLILQYRNKPKARATIEALVKILFGDEAEGIIALDVEEGYSLDNASSAQLDVLGKYIGYSSDVNIIVDNNFKYAEYDDSVNPDTGYSEYNDSVSSLPYAEYRYVTYLKQILNYTDYTKVLNFLAESKGKVLSLGELDSLLNKHFDGNIYVVESDKEVEYHFLQEFLTDFDTDEKLQVFTDKYLPKPMGCSVTVVRDPYYINAIPHGGAENYLDENLIFTRETSDTSMFFETPVKFDFKEYEQSYYPNFHTFKVKARVKLSSSNTGLFTTLDGDSFIPSNMDNLALVKSGGYLMMLTYKTTFRNIVYGSGYVDSWIDVTFETNYKKYNDHAIHAIVEKDGETPVEVNTLWGTSEWRQTSFLYGLAYNMGLIGSIDFMGCRIEIDDEVKWKGYTNKRIQGV